MPFARIVLVRVGVMDGDDEEIYRALKDIEFCKYHVYPEGYMARLIFISGENAVAEVPSISLFS